VLSTARIVRDYISCYTRPVESSGRGKIRSGLTCSPPAPGTTRREKPEWVAHISHSLGNVGTRNRLALAELEALACAFLAVLLTLLAARVAWAAADNAVQIHGGNGFALEFPVSRILCDARILNIFEGAAEIQAQVIARRLLDGTN